MLITEERTFIAREGEVGTRNGDTNIDSDHTAIGAKFKFTSIVAALRENDRSIFKRIGIHDCQSFLKILHSLNHSYRSENLTIAHSHTRFNVVENGRSNKVTVLVAGNLNITTIQNQLCTFFDTFLNPPTNLISMLGGNYRTQVSGS